MESKRQRQAAELIKRNFGMVLMDEGTYIYGNALVTVTGVNINPDYSIARIYVSIYNTEDKQSVVQMMRENYPRLRHSLAERVRRHIRKVPHLEFFMDDTLDEMYELNALFDRLESDNQFGKREEEE